MATDSFKEFFSFYLQQFSFNLFPTIHSVQSISRAFYTKLRYKRRKKKRRRKNTLSAARTSSKNTGQHADQQSTHAAEGDAAHRRGIPRQHVCALENYRGHMRVL